MREKESTKVLAPALRHNLGISRFGLCTLHHHPHARALEMELHTYILASFENHSRVDLGPAVWVAARDLQGTVL